MWSIFVVICLKFYSSWPSKSCKVREPPGSRGGKIVVPSSFLWRTRRTEKLSRDRRRRQAWQLSCRQCHRRLKDRKVKGWPSWGRRSYPSSFSPQSSESSGACCQSLCPRIPTEGTYYVQHVSPFQIFYPKQTNSPLNTYFSTKYRLFYPWLGSSVIQVVLLLIGVCCWLFWFCCYMSQMNPLIGPVLNQRTLLAVREYWVRSFEHDCQGILASKN